MDGGGIWRGFVSITLPYLRNTIVSVVVVLLMLYVQMVTIILVTTRGGPLGRDRDAVDACLQPDLRRVRPVRCLRDRDPAVRHQHRPHPRRDPFPTEGSL